MAAFQLVLSQRMFSPITKHQVFGQCPASGKAFRTETSGFYLVWAVRTFETQDPAFKTCCWIDYRSRISGRRNKIGHWDGSRSTSVPIQFEIGCSYHIYSKMSGILKRAVVIKFRKQPKPIVATSEHFLSQNFKFFSSFYCLHKLFNVINYKSCARISFRHN